MKEREQAQKTVTIVKVTSALAGFNISEQIIVRQDNSLWPTCCS